MPRCCAQSADDVRDALPRKTGGLTPLPASFGETCVPCAKKSRGAPRGAGGASRIWLCAALTLRPLMRSAAEVKPAREMMLANSDLFKSVQMPAASTTTSPPTLISSIVSSLARY